MRAFVALLLPASVHEELAAAAAPLRPHGHVRWTPPAQWHVTLKFLGDIDAATATSMAAVVQRTSPRRPRLRLEGLGQFPPRGPARVLWAGLAGDCDELAAWAAELDAAASDVGVPAETRPFHAHITLGRLRTPRGAATLQAAMKAHSANVRGAVFEPAAVALLRSDLGADGSVYREVARRDLCP